MLATSHTAKLADGNSIHYTDSGAVPHSTNYTTLVMLHGSAFSSHIFCKLYSLVEQQNLRIVTVQRRDYPGSTPYTDEELDDLRNGRKSFLDRLGILLAYFLEYLIQEYNIPRTSMDRSSGGFSILGWSMGTATAMSLLSDPTIIPRDTYLLLEQYVTNLVLYDPPYLAFGYELPPNADVYDPWTDPIAKTPEERYLAFKGWVGSYYTVPEGWSGNIHELDMSRRTDRCTLDSWTPDQFQSCYHQEAAVRSEIHMYHPPMQFTIRDLTQRVVFNEELAQTFFPNVDIVHISAARSNWHSTWGIFCVKQNQKECMDRGEKTRKIHFLEIPHANHFAHYDYPNDFISTIIHGLTKK